MPSPTSVSPDLTEKDSKITMFAVALLSVCVWLSITATNGAAPSTCPNKIKVDKLELDKRQTIHRMAENFLGTIEGSLPHTEIQKLISYVTNAQYTKIPGQIMPIASKQAGFIICFLIGILICVSMPIVGIVMCIKCRKSQKSILAPMMWRMIYASVLLVCALFWLTSACLFLKNNNDIEPRITGIRGKGTKEMQNLQNFAKYVQGDVACLEKEVPQHAQNIKDLINNELIEECRKSAIDTIAQKTHTKDALELVEDQEELNKITTEIKSISKEMRNLKGNEVDDVCRSLSSMVPGSRSRIDSAQKDIKIKIDDLVKQVEGSLDKIEDEMEGAEKTLDKLKVNSKDIDSKVTEEVNKVKAGLNEVETEMGYFINTLKTAEQDINTQFSDKNVSKAIGWVKHILRFLSLPLFAIFGGIIAGTVLGFGSPGTKVGAIGGQILRVTAFFTLFAGVIPVAIACALFCYGYTTDSLLCRPIFGKVRDETFLAMVSEEIQKTVVIEHAKLNLSTIITECKNNSGITEALRVTIQIGTLNLPEVEIENPIKKLSSALDDAKKEVEDLQSNKLKDIRSKLGNFDFVTELGSLRGICTGHSTCASSALPDKLDHIENKATSIKSRTYRLVGEMDTFATRAKKIVDTASTNFGVMTKEELTELKKEVNDKIRQIAQPKIDSAVANLKKALGRYAECGPLYRIFRNTGDIICNYVAPPINGAWFGLGIAMVVIIPTVIFSFKLAGELSYQGGRGEAPKPRKKKSSSTSKKETK